MKPLKVILIGSLLAILIPAIYFSFIFLVGLVAILLVPALVVLVIFFIVAIFVYDEKPKK